MTSRFETSVTKRSLIKVPFTTSTRSTNREPSPLKMTENKSETSETLAEEIAHSSQSSPQAAHPLPNEQRLCNNFKLPPFWKHNPDSWIALIEAKFRISNIITQVNKYMAVLESLSNSELEHLYNIPKPDDENCYDKLITQIHDVFSRDDRDRLDLLLNELTLGDKTPSELMRHLISAAGVEDQCSPQFETILKDRFLRCLPSEIAASSGTWSYTDLKSFANCATQAINASKRYGKTPSVLTINNKAKSNGTTQNNSDRRSNKHFNSFNQQSKRNDKPVNSYGKNYGYSSNRFSNYVTSNNNWSRNQYLGRGQNRNRYASGYICFYHRRFKRAAYRCEGPICKFFYSPYQDESLNYLGRQTQSQH